MPHTTISGLALSLAIVVPALAGAQTAPQASQAPQTPSTIQPTPPAQKPPKADTSGGTPTVYVSANIGYQFGSHDYATNTQFTIYDEPGTLESTGKVKGGFVFDASAAYKLTPTFGVSVGFSTFTSKSDTSVLAQVPHPIFFDQLRIASSTATGLKTSAPALNLDAVWFIPFSKSLDFSVSAGPSIVFVSQDVVTSVTVLPENFPFASPQIDTVAVTKNSKTGFGFNIGADGTYAITERYGIGVTLRYLYAKADVSGLTDKVNVSGFQTLGGVRIKF